MPSWQGWTHGGKPTMRLLVVAVGGGGLLLLVVLCAALVLYRRRQLTADKTQPSRYKMSTSELADPVEAAEEAARAATATAEAAALLAAASERRAEAERAARESETAASAEAAEGGFALSRPRVECCQPRNTFLPFWAEFYAFFFGEDPVDFTRRGGRRAGRSVSFQEPMQSVFKPSPPLPPPAPLPPVTPFTAPPPPRRWAQASSGLTHAGHSPESGNGSPGGEAAWRSMGLQSGRSGFDSFAARSALAPSEPSAAPPSRTAPPFRTISGSRKLWLGL